MGFRVGCQTITWGEGQKAFLDDVFAQVAEAGYEGVEIGFRHIRETPPEVLARQLEKHGLVLAASHIGGNLEDAAQASRERSVLDEILDYLNAVGCHRLMYSGLRYEDAEQFQRDKERLLRAAMACSLCGVHLLYHNHDWEFADNARVMDALLAEAGDTLGLCPDVGWVVKGGADVIAFLDAVRSRIGAVHFKDFATDADGGDTVMLGEGVVPFPQVAEWLRQNAPDLWVIAEQDRAAVPAAEAARRNAGYLREVLFPSKPQGGAG